MEMGAIAPAEIKLVLDRMSVDGGRFGETGVAEGLFSEDELAQALATQFSFDYLDLAQVQLDPDLLEEIPSGLPHRFHFIPISRTTEGLVVAVADPTDVNNLDEL